MSRRIFLGAALVFFTTLPAVAQLLDVSGTYRAEGRNSDGTAYTGTAVITKQGSAHWTGANQAYSGSGLRDGQVVVINWEQVAPVAYVVMGNGELHGTWDHATAPERLLPLRQ